MFLFARSSCSSLRFLVFPKGSRASKREMLAERATCLVFNSMPVRPSLTDLKREVKPMKGAKRINFCLSVGLIFKPFVCFSAHFIAFLILNQRGFK